MTLANMDGF